MHSKLEKKIFNTNVNLGLSFLASLSVGAFIGTFAVPIPVLGTLLGTAVGLGMGMFFGGLYRLTKIEVQEKFTTGILSTWGAVSVGASIGGLLGTLFPGLGTAVGVAIGAAFGLIVGVSTVLSTHWFLVEMPETTASNQANFTLDIDESYMKNATTLENTLKKVKAFFDIPEKKMDANPSESSKLTLK